MVILMLMIFNGALGIDPDINITGLIEKAEYIIECDPTYKPLVIEFLTDDRTECAIRTPNGHCSFFSFQHVEQGKVMLVSDRKPSKEQKFGCEMIFHLTDSFVKIQCSVKFNGTAFVQTPKQMTRYTDFNYTGGYVKISSTENDNDSILAFIVVVCYVIGVLVIVVIIRRSNKVPTQIFRTRKSGRMFPETDKNEVLLLAE